jgi:hypothetical protein
MAKEYKKIFQTNSPYILIWGGKVDFKSKLVRRNKEGNFLLIKGTIPQEEITIVNLYCPMLAHPT